jgi:hypothetical protein
MICPTDVIPWTDENGIRTIWKKKFELITCERCGKEIITRDFADYLIESRSIPEDYFKICDDCKRVELAKKMGTIVLQAEEAKL